jgi:hypothetical protein
MWKEHTQSAVVAFKRVIFWSRQQVQKVSCASRKQVLLTVENNNAFCDVNKTLVKGLNSEYDSTIEDELEIKNVLSYTDVVKGKMEWKYSQHSSFSFF